MAQRYQLSTDEQIWVMIQVKQGLMTMEEALEYVRQQHEKAGLPAVLVPETPPASPHASRRSQSQASLVSAISQVSLPIFLKNNLRDSLVNFFLFYKLVGVQKICKKTMVKSLKQNRILSKPGSKHDKSQKAVCYENDRP